MRTIDAMDPSHKIRVTQLFKVVLLPIKIIKSFC